MTRTSFRWLAFGSILLAAALGLAVAFSVGSLVRLLVICALLAYVLDPAASFLESLGMSRAGAAVLIFVVLGALLAGLGIWLYPTFLERTQALKAGDYHTRANALISRLEELLRTQFAFLGLAKLNLAAEVQRLQGELADAVLASLRRDLVASVARLAVMPLMVFLFLKDGRELKRWVIGLVPNRYFEFSLDLLYKMDLALGNFLRGQFLDGLIFGALATAALWLLHVKYFLFLGIFAGLANLIPYFGPIAGGLLATLVTALTASDLERVGYVLLAFVMAKLLDDSLIQPLVVARNVNMHPLLVLSAVMIGGHFFGLLGLLLAVPVAGFVKVALGAGLGLARKYRFSRLVERE